MKCAKHPEVDTELSCNRCETPICPKCQVLTPVGYKCRDCARPDRSISDLPLPLLIRCLVATFAAGIFGGIIVNSIGLYFLFAPFLGYIIGEVAVKSSGRRFGVKTEIIAGAATLLGLVLPRLVAYPPGSLMGLVRTLGLTDLLFVLGVAIAVVIAVGRVRYR